MSTAAPAIVAKTNVTLGELEMIFLTGEGIQKLQKLKLPDFSQQRGLITRRTQKACSLVDFNDSGLRRPTVWALRRGTKPEL
jgi:peroxiredoxin family protein